MPPISVMMKPASGLCNMHCEYCFYRDEICHRRQQSCNLMSDETLRNIIRRTILRADGMISYVYQGGEPMLRGLEFYQQAISWQQKYNNNNIEVSNALQTNGLLIDEDWCRFFKTNKFLIGVSVDGIEETHDAYRHDMTGSQGTYKRVIEKIEMLDRFEVSYNILTVVNNRTADSIREIYQDYHQRGWHYQQYILCLEPMAASWGSSHFAVNPERYGHFLIELFDLWYSDYNMGKQPYIRQFDNYVALLIGYPVASCEQRGTCSVQYVVEADGNVYPCDFYMLDQYWLGNFNSDQLDIIDRRRLEIGFIDESKKLAEECLNCEYYRICLNGCQRYRKHNQTTGLSQNYFCQAYKMFFAARLDKLKQIAASLLNADKV